jgi:hypothetical protein
VYRLKGLTQQGSYKLDNKVLLSNNKQTLKENNICEGSLISMEHVPLGGCWIIWRYYNNKM